MNKEKLKEYIDKRLREVKNYNFLEVVSKYDKQREIANRTDELLKLNEFIQSIPEENRTSLFFECPICHTKAGVDFAHQDEQCNLIKFNVNDKVKIKLSELGKAIYYHQYDDLNKQHGRVVITPRYPQVDEHGYSEMQLWCIMQLFGQYITMTGTVENNTLPFETTILIKAGD